MNPITYKTDLKLIRENRHFTVTLNTHEKLQSYDFFEGSFISVIMTWLLSITDTDFECFYQILNAKYLTPSQKMNLALNFELENQTDGKKTTLKEIQDHFLIVVELYHTWIKDNNNNI